MSVDVERTALKEWAVLVDAMARGDIVAMVRKGGIREQRSGFEVRHERFLLYPTYFHENMDDLAERFRPLLAKSHERRPAPGTIRIEHLAEVVAVWNVTDLSALQDASHEHGLAPVAVESRFHYRGKPHVRVIAMRTLALARPAEAAEASRYSGCVSWLELDADVAVHGARPVIAEADLQSRLDALRGILGACEVER
jgi:hypothetical protein